MPTLRVCCCETATKTTCLLRKLLWCMMMDVVMDDDDGFTLSHGANRGETKVHGTCGNNNGLLC